MRHVGLSEVGAATIRRTAAVTPIADLQIEYSLLRRDVEDEILPTWRSWAQLERTARDKGCTVAQLALAWVAANGEDIVPVIGARRVEQVTAMLEQVTLSAEEAAELAALIPRGAVAGERYPAAAMADLDSERR